MLVPGDHGLKADLEAVGAAVQAWLQGLLATLTVPKHGPDSVRHVS
jgi:hypothetical protein